MLLIFIVKLMMMKKYSVSTLFLLIFYITMPSGQAQNVEFGKVNLMDLLSESYPADTSAPAAILSDFGKTRILHYDNIGFRLETTRTVRLKIYKSSGYGWADVDIPLYRDDNRHTESVRDITAYSYNVQDGTIHREELSQSDIFEEERNERWQHVKFAIPGVKEGTIVEYQYTKVSPFIFKPADWLFQYDIPVKRSEYHFISPAFYEYIMLYQGYFELSEQDARVHNMEQRLGSYTYTNAEYHWVLEDIPAYRPEEYITTRDDYIAKLIFQLAKSNFPGREVKEYMTTWPNLVEDLMELTDFGKNLKKNYTRDALEVLALDQLPSQLARAQAIYQHVQQNYAWNERYRVSPSQSLRQLLSSKEGNSTDINLLLINMLHQADIQACPVLLSTRHHGKITMRFPVVDQLNNTIVLATLDGKDVLLDATDPDLPFGMIGEACLNGFGLIANPDQESWIDLRQQGAFYDETYVFLKYNAEEQTFLAQVSDKYRDYAALRARKLYREDKEKLTKIRSASNVEYKYVSESEKPFILTYEARYPAESLGDFFYLEPFIGRNETNPFNAPERYYPVDFAFPRTSRYIFNLTIPEGYTLDEYPQNAEYSLDKRSISFSLESKLMGNILQLHCSLQINQSTIPVEQYTELRKLYTDMLNKQMEKIVLKKKATE